MNLIFYAVLALAVMGMVGTGVYKVKQWGANEVRAEWNEANEKARKEADAVNEKNRLIKEKSDAENAKTKRDLAGLYVAYTSLRDQPRHGLLPQAPGNTANPARACFDRGALDNALSAFDRGTTEILRSGDEAIVDLNSARKWAQSK